MTAVVLVIARRVAPDAAIRSAKNGPPDRRSVEISHQRDQGLNAVVELGGGVGVAAGEGEEDALADHAAVFIVGLGQHQDVLGHAARGHHVPRRRL